MKNYSEFTGSAHQAMLADILPEKQRQEGFGILRVVANLSWIIGPSIGGFMASRSFFGLFVSATNFSPAEMRARYMAMFGLTWMIPAIIGPAAAGVILDSYDPNLLW